MFVPTHLRNIPQTPNKLSRNPYLAYGFALNIEII